MKKKVVLIEPNDLEYNKVRKNDLASTQVSEPLGICYIGAVAQKNNYYVKIIQQIDETNEEILKQVLNFKPDYIGISCMAYNYPNSLRLSKILKANWQRPIIFGGVYPSLNFNIIQERTIDFIIYGEGEISFLELLGKLDKNEKDFTSINGLVYIQNGKMQANPPQKRIEDLDSLPFPLRDDLKIGSIYYRRRYLTNPPFDRQIKASINCSRGCHYRCGFCTSPKQWGNQWISRSPSNIVDEIEFLIENYKVNYLEFRDENFTSDKNFVLGICDELIKRRINISWYCQTRIDNIDLEMLKRMKEAKCFQIEYGIETGTSETLKNIRKGISLERAREIIALTDKVGLTTHCLFVIGFPWESPDDLNETLNFMLAIPYDRVRITFYTPFEGTPLWEKLDKGLIQEKDPAKYTTMIPVMKTKYLEIKELYDFRRRAYEKVYNNIHFARRCMEKVKRYPGYYESFVYWFKVLESFVADEKIHEL